MSGAPLTTQSSAGAPQAAAGVPAADTRPSTPTPQSGMGDDAAAHSGNHARAESASCPAAFTTIQDRGMLEWARQRPDDGFVIGVALRLRGQPPAPERLARLVADRLPVLPALAERLEGPARHESWRTDAYFDATGHIHRLDGPSEPHELLEMLVNQPVPQDRPSWGLWLLHAAGRDEYWLGYRVHHAAQDGAAAAHTVRRLLDARADSAAPREDPAGRSRWAPSPAPSTAGERLLASTEVPAGAMRDISRVCGASLHDIYLASLAGALRAWLAPSERSRPAPVRVPFSVRLRSERQDRGNRFGYMRVLLPVDEPRAERRLAATVEQTQIWPRDRNRRILDAMPDQMLAPHISSFLNPQDALATATLLPIPGRLALDSSPVTGGIALPPLVSGYLFSSVLFLNEDRATVSFTSQNQHQHVRDLPRLWAQELAALADAVRS